MSYQVVSYGSGCELLFKGDLSHVVHVELSGEKFIVGCEFSWRKGRLV